MSRSYKKPYHHFAGCKPSNVKFFKKNMTRKSRRILNDEEDSLNGSHYKKLMHSWFWHPGDGKVYDPESKKSHRK